MEPTMAVRPEGYLFCATQKDMESIVRAGAQPQARTLALRRPCLSGALQQSKEGCLLIPAPASFLPSCGGSSAAPAAARSLHLRLLRQVEAALLHLLKVVLAAVHLAVVVGHAVRKRLGLHTECQGRRAYMSGGSAQLRPP